MIAVGFKVLVKAVGRLMLVSSASIVLGSAVHAEDDPSASLTVTSGATIRVAAPTFSKHRLQGVLRDVDVETLALSSSDGRLLQLPCHSIARLEIRQASKRHLLKGLAIGTLTGVFLLPLPFVSAEKWSTTRKLAVAGAVSGAAIGALIRAEQWEDFDGGGWVGRCFSSRVTAER
jgi:hypothetical protein